MSKDEKDKKDKKDKIRDWKEKIVENEKKIKELRDQTNDRSLKKDPDKYRPCDGEAEALQSKRDEQDRLIAENNHIEDEIKKITRNGSSGLGKMKLITSLSVLIILLFSYQNCSESGSSDGSGGNGITSQSLNGTWERIAIECNGITIRASGVVDYLVLNGTKGTDIEEFSGCTRVKENYDIIQDGNEFLVTGGTTKCTPNPCSSTYVVEGEIVNMSCSNDTRPTSSSYRYTYTYSNNLLKISRDISASTNCMTTYRRK